MRIEVSREEELLDTGGGLKKAAQFFLEDGSRRSRSSCTTSMSSAPSISAAWCSSTPSRDALATLAVQERATSRYLLFDSRAGSAAAAPGATAATKWRGPRKDHAGVGLLRHSHPLAAASSPRSKKRARSRSSIPICAWPRRERRSPPSARTNITGATSAVLRASPSRSGFGGWRVSHRLTRLFLLLRVARAHFEPDRRAFESRTPRESDFRGSAQT